MDTTTFVPTRVMVHAESLTPTGWKTLADTSVTAKVYLREGKVSVDTGRFIPNTYRVNNYDVYKEEVSFKSGQITKYATSYGTKYRFTYTGPFGAALLSSQQGLELPVALTKLRDEALLKAYSKLGKAEFSINEDLGELTQTIKMLRHPLSSLQDFLLGKNHSNLDKLADLIAFGKSRKFGGFTGPAAAKAAMDTWLEVRYGFRPLIGSIETCIAAIDYVAKKNFDSDVIRTVRAKRVGTSNFSSTGTVPMWPSSGDGSTVTTDKYTAHACVQYRQSRPYSMREMLGLTPRFLPETAWNLLSLSFVWDWLFTIGPWIESFRFKPEITVLGNSTGMKLEREIKVVQVKFATGYGDSPAPVPPGGSKTFRRYKREVNVSRPIIPVFRHGKTIDLFRSIDLCAIILQSFLRK